MLCPDGDLLPKQYFCLVHIYPIVKEALLESSCELHSAKPFFFWGPVSNLINFPFWIFCLTSTFNRKSRWCFSAQLLGASDIDEIQRLAKGVSFEHCCSMSFRRQRQREQRVQVRVGHRQRQRALRRRSRQRVDHPHRRGHQLQPDVRQEDFSDRTGERNDSLEGTQC